MHYSYHLKKVYNKYYSKEQYQDQEGPRRLIFYLPLEHHDAEGAWLS